MSGPRPFRSGVRAALVLITVLLSDGWLSTSRCCAVEMEWQRSFRWQQLPQILRVLSWLMRRQSASADTPEESASAASAASRDVTAARDRDLEERWQRADQLLARGDWIRGLEILQQVLDEPGDVLIFHEQHWSTLRQLAWERLHRAPVEARRWYEQRYGGAARQALQAAVAQSDASALSRLARRYLHTQAGNEAAFRLACQHFDREEWVLAWWWFQRLEQAQSPLLQEPHVRARVAMTLEQLQPMQAQRWWQSLPDRLELGGIVTERQQLQQFARAHASAVKQLPHVESWTYPHGDACGSSVCAAGQPLFPAEWQEPLTRYPQIQELIREVYRAVHEEGQPAWMVAQPVILPSLLAYRDLRGISVRDPQTGRVLWETVPGISAEPILLSNLRQPDGRDPLWRAGPSLGWQGFAGAQHPLANWLFRDTLLGHLSADDECLYVLEDVATLTRAQSGVGWGETGDAEDFLGAVWTCNRLTAYEWTSGRVRWSVGGVAEGETDDVRLAGAFLLSCPLPRGEVLYVTACVGDELRLYELDRRTGYARWWQRLSFSETKIALDLVRRWIGAPLAESQGVVICATGTGWLIAVDRTQGAILWARRVTPGEKSFGSDPQQAYPTPWTLAERWQLSHPIVCDALVLFCSPESEYLRAFDLVSGDLLWEQSSEGMLHIAGVVANNSQPSESLVVVQGMRSLKGLRLDSGSEAWQQELPADLEFTGRGVLTEQEYIVPVSSGEWWVFDTYSGNVRSRWKAPPDVPREGNLFRAGNRWWLLSGQGCYAFADRSSLADLQREAVRHPENAAVLLRLSEIHLYEQAWDEAEQKLTQLPSPLSDPWLEKRRQRCWWQLWLHRYHSADTAQERQAVLDRLQSLSLSASEQLQLVLWQGESAIAAGRPREAADLWIRWVMAQPHLRLPHPTDSQRDVSLLVFFSQRFEDLWRESQTTVREELDDWLTSRLHEWQQTAHMPAQQLPPVEIPWSARASGWLHDTSYYHLQRWYLAELFWFHPRVVPLWWEIAEEHRQQRRFAHAEAVLSRLMQHPDAESARLSTWRLARLWHDWGLKHDAHWLVTTRLSQPLPGSTADLTENSWWLSQSQEALPSYQSPLPSAVPWKARLFTQLHAPPAQEIKPPAALPDWQRWHIQYEPLDNRLAFRDPRQEHWYWLAPLKVFPRAPQTQHIPYRFVDHRLYLVARGMLQCLSPYDRTILWALPANDPATGADALARVIPTPLGRKFPEDFVAYPILQQQLYGPLVAAFPHYIAWQEGRLLKVLDPLTGDLLWSRRDLSPQTQVFGTRNLLIAVTDLGRERQVTAWRVRDGEAVPLPEPAQHPERLLTIVDDMWILADHPRLWGLPFLTGAVTIRAWNSQSNTIVWQVQLPRQARWSICHERLVVFPVETTASNSSPWWLDLRTARKVPLQPTPLPRGDVLTPVSDSTRLYLIVHRYADNMHSYADSLPAIPVHGHLLAWDWETGQLLWQQNVQNQHLVLQRLSEAPVLVCLTRSWRPQAAQQELTQLDILVLHKQTGDVLLTHSSLAIFGGYHTLKVHLQPPAIDVLSYNQRMHLYPADTPSAAERPPEEAAGTGTSTRSP
ncbi:MAG: hypothetical protein KatS3mg114_1200 [Planctomycetaceae bacterium]|nr:MAG: hypothetical protein KatS3mg114_1200 [Planctomycetaceae bacterium]